MLLVKQAPVRSRAGEAGLREGDAIVAVDALPITSAALLPSVALRNETQITVTVERNGVDEPVTLEIPLTGEPASLGLSWREDPAEPGAVYVTRVVPFSPTALAGIELFDRIYALDGAPIQGQADLLAKVRELLADNATSLRLEIESRGQLRETVVSLELPATESGDSSL
jgi:S1-C subfamily serine protease